MDEVAFAPARHRVDVEAYFRMGAAGVFDGAQRIELIEGDLIDMAPIGQEHEAVAAGLTAHLVLTCQGRATVWVRSSIRLSGWSAPEPDLCVLKRRADFYGTGERAGPGAAARTSWARKTAASVPETLAQRSGGVYNLPGSSAIQGAAFDAGRGAVDLEGRPLTAAFVAGRHGDGSGLERSLSPEDLDAVSTRTLGTVPKAVTTRELGRGNDGVLRYVDDPVNRTGTYQILVHKDLYPESQFQVGVHDMGDVLDKRAFTIDPDPNGRSAPVLGKTRQLERDPFRLDQRTRSRVL